jgi:hypothetical protein
MLPAPVVEDLLGLLALLLLGPLVLFVLFGVVIPAL